MSLPIEQLNRTLLARQRLDRRVTADPVDVIGDLVGLQTQDPVSAYLALWNRIENFDPSVLDRAFISGDVVRCTLMRLTLHTVRRQDHPVFAQAMQPTLRSRFGDPRYAGTGLTRADLDLHEPPLLEFLAQPRSSDEIAGWFTARLDDPAQVKGIVWALRSAGHLVRAPGEGPWSFRTKADYQVAPSRPERDDLDAADAALETLVVRYLAGYGPGTAADVAQFAMVPQARAKRALQRLADTVVTTGGTPKAPVFDLPHAVVVDPQVPQPARLLGMWDNVLLSHVDRTRMIPEELRRVVIRVNGDVLPTVLLDGRVAGVWRSTENGIEVTALRPFRRAEWSEIEPEAVALHTFLRRRDLAVYRRHDHWWAKLPPGSSRTFADHG